MHANPVSVGAEPYRIEDWRGCRRQVDHWFPGQNGDFIWSKN